MLAGRTRNKADVGLVGGRIDARVAHAKVPPVDHPLVLAPFRRADSDEARFGSFVRTRPLHVEIGFGRPHHLCDLAAARPQTRVLGFEIRRRWVRAAARRAEREALANLRVVEGDARPYITRLVPSGGIDAVHVLFPDPWWKKRHHKRRVFQPEFIDILEDKLADGGELVFKSDVEAYADLVWDLLSDRPRWRLAGRSEADPGLAALPRSHREKKCAELGIPITAFRFVKESVTS